MNRQQWRKSKFILRGGANFFPSLGRGWSLRPKGLKPEAHMTESGGGVFGEGAASTNEHTVSSPIRSGAEPGKFEIWCQLYM